jgi:hypothetical protein
MAVVSVVLLDVWRAEVLGTPRVYLVTLTYYQCMPGKLIIIRRAGAMVARQTSNLKVAGSIPAFGSYFASCDECR